MKNKFPLLLLLLTSSCYDALAQDTKFGMAVGINSAQSLPPNSGYNFTDYDNAQSGIGYSFGAFAEVSLKHNIVFQPSLSFIKKNTTFSSAFSTTNAFGSIVELSLNYLYRPILKSGFLLGAGPSFSLGSYSEKNTIVNVYPNYPNYSNTTTSFALGCGVNFLVKYELNQQIAIASNFNLDLQPGYRHQYFGLNIQYSF
jgi:hypothetical protein